MAEACAVGRSRIEGFREEKGEGDCDKGWLTLGRGRRVKARAPSSPPVTRRIRFADMGRDVSALMLL